MSLPVCSSVSFSQHNKQRCVSLSYGECVVCWLPLSKECPDACVPFTHTHTHTKPQSSTLVPVFWTGLASLCSCRFSQVIDSVFALSPPPPPSSSSSLLLTSISSSPSRRRPSHIVCFGSLRQPPNSKPAWPSSWRSSCPRSRRTSAASSPMTPNKQVRSRLSRGEARTKA